MKRIVLVFGVISGLIASGLMLLTLPLLERDTGINPYVTGYATILLSLLLVFFGIRSYRENVGHGSISFGRAFAVGILITLISCIFYVASWEVIYFNFMPDFVEKYTARTVETMRQKGATDAAIADARKEMAEMKVMLDNPALNAAMTFIEPFPVGLVVTLISAAILRRRKAAPEGTAAAAVA